LCERWRGRRRGAREGACTGAATMPQPWILKLILNAAALEAASPVLLFRVLQKISLDGFIYILLPVQAALLLQDIPKQGADISALLE